MKDNEGDQSHNRQVFDQHNLNGYQYDTVENLDAQLLKVEHHKCEGDGSVRYHGFPY